MFYVKTIEKVLKRKKSEKNWIKSTRYFELFFENVELPAENILGKSGQGFFQLMDELPQERLLLQLQQYLQQRLH